MQLKYTQWHDILISQDVYGTKSPKLSYITQAKAICIFMQQSLKVYVVSESVSPYLPFLVSP